MNKGSDNPKMKRIAFTSLILSFVLILSSLSCFDPLDHFAVEVVLNKPNISYNLTPIEKANNVIIEDGIIIYRSHFNKQVAVMLEEIKADLGNGNIFKGLSVKIQIPAKIIATNNISSGAVIDFISITQVDEPFIKSLGYDVKVEKIESQANIYMKKDNVTFSVTQFNININPFLNIGEKKISISLFVSDAESLDDKIKLELGQIIKSLGLDEKILVDIEAGLTKYITENLIEAMDIKKEEFDFKSAMKTELEWLTSNNLILGIGNDDIQTIAELSKAGIAGWNSRIIYAKGKWLPFYESGFGMLRDGGANCGGFEPKKIPDGELELEKTAIKQTSKAVTRWGEIKSRLL
jgi:hypothetical protein